VLRTTSDLAGPDSIAGLADRVRTAELPAATAVRIVLVDGPAGSGKSTLAARLAVALGHDDSAAVLHLDELLEGWSGLGGTFWARVAEQVLEPVARGVPARYQRYDWEAERLGDWVDVPPHDVLVVEGVGAAARAADQHASYRIWVEAPRDVRLARGIARDGDDFRDTWLGWMDREAAHFAADGTRERADVVLDGEVWLPDVRAEG
jgi:uridine kinase